MPQGHKGLMLFSGGLDSILALRLMLEMGVEMEAVHFSSPFCRCVPGGSSCADGVSTAARMGVKLHNLAMKEDFLEVIKHPPHGYGSGMNPCIDCRILMFSRARELMKKIGADFIVTGEVLGERPMSQRMGAMKLIEEESGLQGLIVRPLCAKLMPPSIPEKEGWVDRNKLLAIRGRRRKPQMELAERLGINDYPCPAGGCLLTDPAFAARLRDLIRNHPDCTINDVLLIMVGRYFRLSPSAMAVVGRNHAENLRLKSLRKEGDAFLEAVDVNGPVTVVRGEIEDAVLQTAAGLTVRYGQAAKRGLERVEVRCERDGEVSFLHVALADLDAEALDGLRVDVSG